MRPAFSKGLDTKFRMISSTSKHAAMSINQFIRQKVELSELAVNKTCPKAHSILASKRLFTSNTLFVRFVTVY